MILKIKGELKIFTCTNVIPAYNLNEIQIEISDIQNQETNIRYPLSELIIRPKNVFLSISRSYSFRESEVNLMKWLKKRHLQVFIYLKKPVNNLEIGYIQIIDVNIQKSKKDSHKGKNNDRNVILFNNIFGKEIEIPYKELDIITFEYNSAVIQLKSETSVTSKLGFKILKKFKPERIIMP